MNEREESGEREQKREGVMEAERIWKEKKKLFFKFFTTIT
jgi:hypothetical protein